MMRRLPLILLLLAAVLPGCRRDPLPEDGPQAKPEEMGGYDFAGADLAFVKRNYI